MRLASVGVVNLIEVFWTSQLRHWIAQKWIVKTWDWRCESCNGKLIFALVMLFQQSVGHNRWHQEGVNIDGLLTDASIRETERYFNRTNGKLHMNSQCWVPFGNAEVEVCMYEDNNMKLVFVVWATETLSACRIFSSWDLTPLFVIGSVEISQPIIR